MIFLSSNTFENTKEVSIYPNPTNSLFYLELPQNNSLKLLEIYDITGKLIKIFNTFNNDKSVDVTELEEGVYLLKIYESDDKTTFMKLIKAI